MERLHSKILSLRVQSGVAQDRMPRRLALQMSTFFNLDNFSCLFLRNILSASLIGSLDPWLGNLRVCSR
jgi:hypothetical protein